MIGNYVVKGSALAVMGMVAEGIAKNQIQTVTIMVAFVSAVVGGMAWLKNQIREQIHEHATQDAQRHALVLEKIEHLKELMETKLERIGN